MFIKNGIPPIDSLPLTNIDSELFHNHIEIVPLKQQYDTSNDLKYFN